MRIDAHIRALLPSDNRDAWRQLADLRPGDQISARVTAILENGQARIDLGGIRTLADIRIPVTIGDQLALVVADVGETLHLRLATATDIAGARAEGPLTADAMARLREQIQLIFGNTGKAPAPESPLARQLSHMTRHLAPLTISAGAETLADRIRNTVNGSGLFFEKRLSALLARPGTPASPAAAAQNNPAPELVKALLDTDGKALLGRLLTAIGADRPAGRPLRDLQTQVQQALDRLDRAQDRLLAGPERPLIYRAAPAGSGARGMAALQPWPTAGGRIRPAVLFQTAGTRSAPQAGTVEAIDRRLADVIARVHAKLDPWGKSDTGAGVGKTIGTAEAAEALARTISDEADRTGLFLKSAHAAAKRLASGRMPGDGTKGADRLQAVADAVRAAIADDTQRIRSAMDQARRTGAPAGETADARSAGMERGPEMGPSITFALPLAHTETPAHLRVYYRKRRETATTDNFRLSLLLCLDRLGEIRCDFWLHNRQLDIAFYTARESTRKRIAAEAVRLEPALSDRFDRLAITTARHPQRATAFESTPLDIGSPGGVHVTA